MIVGLVPDATGKVVTTNVADVAPPGIVTLAGTWAAGGLLLTRVTTAPPKGAGPFNVTVPVEGVPPTTVSGFKLRLLSVADEGVTVRMAVCVTEL